MRSNYSDFINESIVDRKLRDDYDPTRTHLKLIEHQKNTALNYNKALIAITFILLLTTSLIELTSSQTKTQYPILSYIVDAKKQDIQLYWKDEQGEKIKSIQHLKTYVERNNLTLTFAMNGGMFTTDYAALGLFIQQRKIITPLNNRHGAGNFYVKPNGVFYITTDNNPMICRSADFRNNGKIKYATQSGPMLVINGKIHPAFKKGSIKLNIRNGVGILPNNKVVFAISKTEINFYDFAEYFQQLGCKNALYLDGFVSRMYLPEKNWTQTDGNFGVLIGVTKKKSK